MRRARPWPDEREAALDGVFLLRDVDDALALRAAFAGGPRVAIVGAGFIGCEVAATARKLGLDVTLIEMARAADARRSGPSSASTARSCTASTASTCGSGRASARCGATPGSRRSS